MHLSEQQLTLIHTRINVLLTLDVLRDTASRVYGPRELKILEVILGQGHYWALPEFSPEFSLDGDFKFLEKPEYVEEVFAILRMFQENEDIRDKFIGFDRNHEFIQDSVYEFVVNVIGIYKSVVRTSSGPAIRTLPLYQKLLEKHGRHRNRD